MKNNKIIEKLFVLCFIFILFFFMIFTLLSNKKISLTERRTLKTFPSFSISSIFKKRYYDDLTSAFSDQLMLRNYLVKGYFIFQFQRYYGDVVKGKNNQLYSSVESTPKENYYNKLKNTISLVNDESKKSSAKFIFLSIPRKDAYMTRDLPSNYTSSIDIYKKQVMTTKNSLDKSIIFIDALEVFEKSNIYNCYYSNDHHITPRCAYSLYSEINKYTKVNSYNLDDMFTVNKTYVNGAYNRQLGQTVKAPLEDLYLTPKKDIKYKRYEDEKHSKKKIYGSGNSYEDAYMEGDMAFTRVETFKKTKNIMYVGSSYTNILEALSIPSYNRMISIDYRHNKSGNPIDYYVEKYNIDYVVFIPSQSNNAYSIEKIRLHLGK